MMFGVWRLDPMSSMLDMPFQTHYTILQTARINEFCMQSLVSRAAILVTACGLLEGQTTPAPAKPAVPEWSQPGSATRTQVAPPSDFHRPSTHFNTAIGIFEGQSDVGT